MVIVSPMFVVQIKENSFSYGQQILFVVIMFISYRRFTLQKVFFYNRDFIEPFIAGRYLQLRLQCQMYIGEQL